VPKSPEVIVIQIVQQVAEIVRLVLAEAEVAVAVQVARVADVIVVME